MASAIELAEAGIPVDIVGPVDALRWPRLSEGGINVGSDPETLLRESVACGAYLAPRAPLRSMASAATEVISWLESIGVPFARDDDGALALRRLTGAREPGAAYVEGRTTQLIAAALDTQLLRLEQQRQDGEPLVRRFVPFELVSLVLNEGRCVGCVAQDLVTMQMQSFTADAVVLASGGPERLFLGYPGALCCEAANLIAFEAGAVYANAELVQLHPAALGAGERLMVPSSAIRGEGGRLWVPRDTGEARIPRDIPNRERDYFLEERYPGFGNLVPDDLAAAAVHEIAVEKGRGVYNRRERENEPVVYLDISHLPEAHLRSRLASELDACTIAAYRDAYRDPVKVAPAMVGGLGGLWVDHEVDDEGHLVAGSPRNHASSILGLYAAGDSAHLYHGACRMDGNGLLADLFGARTTAQATAAFIEAEGGVELDGDDDCHRRSRAQQLEQYAALADRSGDGDAIELFAELASIMRGEVAFARSGEALAAALDEVVTIRARSASAASNDEAATANRGRPFLRALERMALLAELTVVCAAQRDERRGVHLTTTSDGEGEPLPEARATLARMDDDGGIELLPEGFEHGGELVSATVAADGFPWEPRNYSEPSD